MTLRGIPRWWTRTRSRSHSNSNLNSQMKSIAFVCLTKLPHHHYHLPFDCVCKQTGCNFDYCSINLTPTERGTYLVWGRTAVLALLMLFIDHYRETRLFVNDYHNMRSSASLVLANDDLYSYVSFLQRWNSGACSPVLDFPPCVCKRPRRYLRVRLLTNQFENVVEFEWVTCMSD